MALYPSQVPINESELQRLTKLLKQGYIDIISEIQGATDFGVYNRNVILAQVENILTGLGVDVAEFLQRELPDYYKSGAYEAVKQLRNIGAEINVKTGFNTVHQEAIMGLILDTAEAFGESLTGIGRSANLLLGRATREAITQKIGTGLLSGEGLRDIRLMIKGLLEEQGLSALVDKGGRVWELDTYAEMLFRTKAVEARNRGLVNRLSENGYDLVQVSEHGDSCEACAEWEGKILSISGKDPDYPSLAEAEANGLFHPNCRHAINTLIPKLARETEAYEG